jgi:hypothetical protein
MTTYNYNLELDGHEFSAVEVAVNFFKLKEVQQLIRQNPMLITDFELQQILTFADSDKLKNAGTMTSTSSFVKNRNP